MHYRIENLNVEYKDKQGHHETILRDICLEIRDSEFIGLMGSSGSGKTQLAQALARLNEFNGAIIKASKQTFTHDSKIYTLSVPEELMEFRSKHISYIFQEAYSYFNPVKKIKDHFTDFKLKKESILNMMETMSLQEKERILEAYPHQLSGGQLQRLAILKTLIKRPSIIIADEIDSALDETNARLVMSQLLKLKAEFGFALIWITHDQQKAKEMGSTIWYVENGALKYSGEASNFEPIAMRRPKKMRSQSNSVLVRLDSVSKTYQRTGNWWKARRTSVLNSIGLEINSKEMVGLIGASGSGKSTIGKIITGLEPFDSGSVWIKGIEYKNITPSKDIIYLFQDAYSALNPKHSTEEILREALSIAKSKLTIQDLLKMGKLEITTLDKKPNQISGGMRQRLALIRAIALNPILMVLDESLNAMDETIKQEIIELLLTQQSETGMSILLISHQLPELITLADRIYKLEEGNIELYDLHRY